MPELETCCECGSPTGRADVPEKLAEEVLRLRVAVAAIEGLESEVEHLTGELRTTRGCYERARDELSNIRIEIERLHNEADDLRGAAGLYRRRMGEAVTILTKSP